MEGFLDTLKTKRVYHERSVTRTGVSIFECLEVFYNQGKYL